MNDNYYWILPYAKKRGTFFASDIKNDMENNILQAESVFKENPENNILRSRRLNLMQTKEAGNNLKFF